MTEKTIESPGVATVTSRRNLLLMLAGGVASLALFASPSARLRPTGLRGAAASLPGLRNLLSLAHGDMTEWQARTGDSFRAAGYRLDLAGIEPLPSKGVRPSGLRDRAFLAVFDVAGGAAMPGNLIYRFVPSAGRAFDLFLTHAGDPARPGRMHALFN